MAEHGTLRTLTVSFGVALVCAILVSVSVVLLRPLQANHGNAAFNRLLLRAAGMAGSADTSSNHEVAAAAAALTRVRVSLGSAASQVLRDEATGASAFPDARSATVEIPEPLDRAGLQVRPPTMTAWLVDGAGGVERVVLPVYGQGMWSTIRALVAVDAQTATVRDLVIVSHGETPGIGDRIEAPSWQATWQGLVYANPDASVALTLGGDDAAHAVDAITGATVTTESLVDIVAYWLGDDAYGPFLAQLRERRGDG